MEPQLSVRRLDQFGLSKANGLHAVADVFTSNGLGQRQIVHEMSGLGLEEAVVEAPLWKTEDNTKHIGSLRISGTVRQGQCSNSNDTGTRLCEEVKTLAHCSQRFGNIRKYSELLILL